MSEAFDAYEYLGYISRRWAFIALACGVAAGVSLAVSFAIPKRYTATASVVIEPPGANDVRTATAVSPIYLESLKSYERYAASDTLFAKAVERFHLRNASQSIESLKRQVLKVSKLRDTKILEIAASLPDPKQAQGLAQFLAEETVTLSRSGSVSADREMIEQAQQQLTQAQTRFDMARAAQTESAAREPVEGLQAEIEGGSDLLSKIRQKLVGAQEDAAEWGAREKTQSASTQDTAEQATFARQQLEGARARASTLERRASEMEATLAREAAVLSQRINHAEQLQADLKEAQTGHEGALNRLHEVQASAGGRGERLRVIDPGIVPERPSSPNRPAIVIAGVLFALVASLVASSLRFVYQRGKSLPLEEPHARRVMVR